MESIGAFEAKTHFSALLERVAEGETIVVTRHGRPVARLVPFDAPPPTDRRAIIADLRKSRATRTLDGLDWRTLRDEGRR